MTTPLRLAVFDLDGTIVDSLANIVRAVREAADIHNVTCPMDTDIPKVIGLSLYDALAALFPGVDPPVVQAMDKTYRELFVRYRTQPDYDEPLFDGTLEALKALEDEGVLLGIATGKARRGVTHVLERHGLAGRFVTIQTPDTCRGKPDPDMLHRAMAETGCAPMHTVMIGDTAYDMHMARAAGVAAIGVSWGNHPVVELQAAGAHRLIDRLSDLAHAVSVLTSSSPPAEVRP